MALLHEMKEKILAEYPYKIETHTHTGPISPCSDTSPAELVELYKKTGVSAIALTNHFTSNPLAKQSAREYAAAYVEAYRSFKICCEEAGIVPIFGIEIGFDENRNEYLLFGIDEEDVLPLCEYFPLGLQRFTEEYKREGMLLIHAHPKRTRGSLSVPDMPTSLIDAIETFNMHTGHNSRQALAVKMANEANMISTGGSDFHYAGHEGGCLIRSRVLPTDSHSLADLIRTRDFVLDIHGSIILP